SKQETQRPRIIHRLNTRTRKYELACLRVEFEPEWSRHRAMLNQRAVIRHRDRYRVRCLATHHHAGIARYANGTFGHRPPDSGLALTLGLSPPPGQTGLCLARYKRLVEHALEPRLCVPELGQFPGGLPLIGFTEQKTCKAHIRQIDRRRTLCVKFMSRRESVAISHLADLRRNNIHVKMSAVCQTAQQAIPPHIGITKCRRDIAMRHEQDALS